MFKRKLLAAVSIIGVLTLTGCSSLDVAHTEHVSAPVSEFSPSKAQLTAQMKGHGNKVIIVPVEYSAAAGKYFVDEVYDDLTQRVMKSENTVVDRKLALKLKDELIAAEKSGKFRTNGPSVADIALLTKIVGLNTTSTFYKSRSWVDDKGKRQTTDAFCKFSSEAKLFVRAYQMPSMELINTYEYDGSESFNSDTRDSRCPISNAQMRSLDSKALADAVKSGSFKTINDLAPESYVIERRDEIGKPHGTNSLFQVTIGKRQGAVDGATVKFYHKEKEVTPITNEVRIQNILVGEGKVIKDKAAVGSYVHVSDEAVINKIMIGDVAKLDHGKCEAGEYEVLGSCVKVPGL